LALGPKDNPSKGQIAGRLLIIIHAFITLRPHVILCDSRYSILLPSTLGLCNSKETNYTNYEGWPVTNFLIMAPGESEDERDERVAKLWDTLDTRKEGHIDLTGLKKGLKKIDHRE
jgi:hypothetical protein